MINKFDDLKPWVLGVLVVGNSSIFQSFSWGASANAAEILNRSNRTFDLPPKSLKADKENKEFRVKAEAARVENGLKSEEDNSIAVPTKSLTTTLPSETDYENLDSSSSTTTTRSLKSKIKNRDALRRGYGFSGERVFGVGFVGAGAYGIFAGEMDVAVSDNFSVGLGLGTGMSYSTWGLYGRYYLKQGELNSFFQFGYANWYMGKAPSSPEDLAPGYLASRFFLDQQGNLPETLRVHLAYPAIGVLYQHSSGLAMTGQLQYLINLQDFFGGLAGALGFHYYF